MNNSFNKNDNNNNTKNSAIIIKNKKNEKNNFIELKLNTVLGLNPPILLWVGTILSIIWLGFCAYSSTYIVDYVKFDSLSDKLESHAKILLDMWNDYSSSTRTSVDTNNMDETIMLVYHDLLDWSNWLDKIEDKLYFSVDVGIIVGSILTGIGLLIPLLKSYDILIEMQTGIWRKNNTDFLEKYELSDQSLLSMSTIFLGCQLGIAALSYCFTFSIITAIVFIGLEISIEEFLWYVINYCISLFSLSVISYFLHLYLLSIKNSCHQLSLVAFFISVFDIIPSQLFAIWRFIFYFICEYITWYRIDIPLKTNYMIVDYVHHSYISLLYFQHQIKNPILYVAVSVLRYKWKRKPKNRKAELRWFLAYTLIKNPSLIQYRIYRKNNSNNIYHGNNNINNNNFNNQEGGNENNLTKYDDFYYHSIELKKSYEEILPVFSDETTLSFIEEISHPTPNSPKSQTYTTPSHSKKFHKLTQQPAGACMM